MTYSVPLMGLVCHTERADTIPHVGYSGTIRVTDLQEGKPQRERIVAVDTHEDIETVILGEAETKVAQELGDKIKNADLAVAIVATDQDYWPSDPDAVADFLVINRDQESKALRKWLSLNRTIGAKLKAAEKEYRELSARSRRLFDHLSDAV